MKNYGLEDNAIKVRVPSITVEGPITYQGVRVNHPLIVATIKNMIKQGKKLEEIMRITGMPGEVVRKYMT